MSTTRKVVIGIGIAGSALLAAWLLTGDRKKKTKNFFVKRANDLNRTLKRSRRPHAEREADYV